MTNEDTEKTKQKIRETLMKKGCYNQGISKKPLDLSNRERNEKVLEYLRKTTEDENGQISSYLGTKKYLKLTDQEKQEIFYNLIK